jgi:hypothetical protein
MVKGYEFEKDRFVLFAPDELKALEDASSLQCPTVMMAGRRRDEASIGRSVARR